MIEIVVVPANDVLVIVAAPADMPTAIPIPAGIVSPAASTVEVSATTAPACVVAPTTTAPACVVATTTTTSSDVASVPTAATKVATASTHATDVATSPATSTHAATATPAAATDERDVTLGRAERPLQIRNAGVCLPHY